MTHFPYNHVKLPKGSSCMVYGFWSASAAHTIGIQTSWAYEIPQRMDHDWIDDSLRPGLVGPDGLMEGLALKLLDGHTLGLRVFLACCTSALG